MAELDYFDFDLLIEQLTGGYRARLLNSPAGQTTVSFRLPFTSSEFEDFLAHLPFPVQEGWPSSATGAEEVRNFGGRLFDAVFAGTVRGCFERSLEIAGREAKGLRVRLRLADAPELASLPWELLYNSTSDRFLALSVETPLVRYLDLPEPVRPLAIKPPLRLLAVIASPTDYPPLDIEREWSTLNAALDEFQARGLLALDRLGRLAQGDEPATLTALQGRLRRGEYHILHFVGHGGFDAQAADGVLLLENEAGEGQAVSGRVLATLLSGHHPLRLIVLNACEGARTAVADAFSGVAPRLVQQGIPAVIAMQRAISDRAAATFAAAFYGAVADGFGVDAALAEARKALYGLGSEAEWATPVLYLRAPDGCIFDVEVLSAAEQRQAQIAALLRAARGAMAVEDWATAGKRAQAILALDPAHAEAAALAKKARDWQEAIGLYDKGREHSDAGHWREALDCFRRVQELAGNYRGVFALMATCQHEIEMNEAPAPPSLLPSSPQVVARVPDPLDGHYRMVVKAISDGKVVPFLGAGGNLCGRPAGIAWRQGQYLPSGQELAAHLSENFGYPINEVLDLTRVSQYVTVMTGSGPLYEELHALFDADYPPNPLHQLLATLPALQRARGYARPYQIIVMTNYDDVLERAFRAAGEAFDLVTYVAEGEQRGKFWHWPPGGEARLVERPNEYLGLAPDQRTTILKIHGAVDRANPERDSFVITEDHYIDYLTRADISSLLPATLTARLKRSHFLFLGYSLRDWNLRVILHRIWGEQKLTYKSWAIQKDPQVVDQQFWRKRDVDILDIRLEDYVAALSERLLAFPHAGGGP